MSKGLLYGSGPPCSKKNEENRAASNFREKKVVFSSHVLGGVFGQCAFNGVHNKDRRRRLTIQNEATIDILHATCLLLLLMMEGRPRLTMPE